jgi:hypothetical protein
MTIDGLIQRGVPPEASDLHLVEGGIPLARVHGALRELEGARISTSRRSSMRFSPMHFGRRSLVVPTSMLHAHWQESGGGFTGIPNARVERSPCVVSHITFLPLPTSGSLRAFTDGPPSVVGSFSSRGRQVPENRQRRRPSWT